MRYSRAIFNYEFKTCHLRWLSGHRLNIQLRDLNLLYIQGPPRAEAAVATAHDKICQNSIAAGAGMHTLYSMGAHVYFVYKKTRNWKRGGGGAETN